MTTATTTTQTPRRFSDDPLKWDEFVAMFVPRQIAVMIGTTVVFNLLAEIISFAISGHAANGGLSGVVVPWLLVVTLTMALFASRHRVLASTERRIPFVMWVFAVNQIFWLAALAWYAVPVFSIVLAVGLCAIAFHDARYFYNALFLHLYYLLVWPGFFAFLLLIDLCGGHGLLARAAADPKYLHTAIPIVIAIVFILQLVVYVVGAQWRELDAKLWAHGRLQAQLAEMRREREVIVRSCDFLVQGLAAGRFSHDVASPVSTVALSAGELLEGLDQMSDLANVDPIDRTQLLPLIGQLRMATERIGRGHTRIHEMATTMARSLRDGATAAPISSATLIEQALREQRAALERHKVTPLEPKIDVAPSTVYVSVEHAAAIGSIMCNGILHGPEAPLHVLGRPANEWFYVLSIRDFGVEGEVRTRAIARVRSQLALAEPASQLSEQRSYEGFGMGLMLAKILFLRHNGYVTVASPTIGRGLLFVVVMPRRLVGDIPVSENSPELVAERWAAELATSGHSETAPRPSTVAARRDVTPAAPPSGT
ncbi:MAG TPA: hypothetical protein VIU64_22825 [Polyangia bacterium]